MVECLPSTCEARLNYTGSPLSQWWLTPVVPVLGESVGLSGVQGKLEIHMNVRPV